MKLYKKYSLGTASLTGNLDKDKSLEGVIGALPQAAGMGASLVGNGDDMGFRTRTGIAAKSGLTGMSIGASIGKNFGPIGTLIGGSVGGGVGSLTGLIRGKYLQKQFLKEQAAMASAKNRDENNLSSAKIAADPELVYGNRDSEMYATGGPLPVPPAGKEFDAVPLYSYAVNARHSKNEGAYKNALNQIYNAYGQDAAREIDEVSSRVSKSADLKKGMFNISRDGLASSNGSRYLRNFYQMAKDGDVLDRFKPDVVPNQSLAVKENGGKLNPLSEDTVEVVGNSHAEGGVKLPGLGAEVEGKETITKDFVFSDKLGFAKLHKPIAKSIGKIEKKPQTAERVKALKHLNTKQNNLALMQESLKAAYGIS